MSYHIKVDENTTRALRRIVRKQIERAIDEARSSKHNSDSAIHNARVCFKKIRAALKLARYQLGPGYARENRRYRDLGRKLSAVRNNVAVMESIDKLKQHFADSVSPKLFSDLRRPFARNNAKQRNEKRKALKEISALLRSAETRVQKWHTDEHGFREWAAGLRHAYKQARRAFWTARDNSTVANLHEWRKATKTLWYQIRILRPLWPDFLAGFAAEVETLGDFLSDDHDLALVRDTVAKYSLNDKATELETLVALIDERRVELQFQAMFLGGRIFAEKPRHFIQRFARYWTAWRAELKTARREISAGLSAHSVDRAA
jgi:CHAD domain-containing protein